MQIPRFKGPEPEEQLVSIERLMNNDVGTPCTTFEVLAVLIFGSLTVRQLSWLNQLFGVFPSRGIRLCSGMAGEDDGLLVYHGHISLGTKFLLEQYGPNSLEIMDLVASWAQVLRIACWSTMDLFI